MMRNFVALVFLATSSSYGFVPRDSPCLRPLSRGDRTEVVLKVLKEGHFNPLSNHTDRRSSHFPFINDTTSMPPDAPEIEDKPGAEDNGTTTENGGSGISASHNPYNRPDPRDDEWRNLPFFLTPEEQERFDAEYYKEVNTDNGPEYYHYDDEIGAAIREENYKSFEKTRKLLSALGDDVAEDDFFSPLWFLAKVLTRKK